MHAYIVPPGELRMRLAHMNQPWITSGREYGSQVLLVERDPVLDEISEERRRQEVKWGEQNHPMLDQALLNREGGCDPQRMTQEYELPSESRAKFMCEQAFKDGTGTYMHILVEEVSEAASEFDLAKMRVELIQVAAVAVAMIQSIDRNNNQERI